MNKKETFPQKFGNFIKSINGLLQMGLLPVALLYGMFVWQWPSPFNWIGFIVGEGLLGLVSILSNSIAMQRIMLEHNRDSELHDMVESETVKIPVSIPTMSVFLIRNTLTVVGIVMSWVLIWGGFFYVISAAGEWGRASELSEQSFMIVAMMIALPGGIMAFYGSAMAFGGVATTVDRYLYPNQSIRQVFYKPEDEEKEFSLWGFVKGAGRLVLGLIAMGVLGALTVGIRLIDFDTSTWPDWLLYVCMGGMLILPVVGLFWSFRWLSGSKARIHSQIEAAIIEEYGEDSPELQEFRAIEEQQSNSIEGQALNKGFKVVMGMFALVFIGIVIFAVILSTLGVSGEQRETLMTVVLCGAIILIFFGFSVLGRFIKIDIPEEVQEIEVAVKQGDYKTAIQYADIILTKMPPIEANIIAAVAYATSNNLQRAETLLRDGLKLVLDQDEEKRNPVWLTNYLVMLASLIMYDGRYQEAEQLLHQARQHSPNDVKVYGNLAELALRRNEAPQIILDYLGKALALNEKKPEAEKSDTSSLYLLKAWALTRAGDYRTAYQWMQDAFQLADKEHRPMMAELHYLSGLIALERGKDSTAQIAFSRAMQSDPDGLYAELARKRLNS